MATLNDDHATPKRQHRPSSDGDDLRGSDGGATGGMTRDVVVDDAGENNSTTVSLDEYSTFQYMLARPAIARATIRQISSFVMYNEPHDGGKEETEHRVLVRGNVTLCNYYCCCLVLLPSHVMGMSRWVSAEDCQFSGGEKSDEHPRKKAGLEPGDALRRFRYSYYGGLLQVDTRHVFVGHADDGKDPTRFRLVEYLECPISPWVIVHAVYGLLASLLGYRFRTYYGYANVSYPLVFVSALALLHLILALTGVKMW